MNPHFRASLRAKLSDQARLRQESHFGDRLERKQDLSAKPLPCKLQLMQLPLSDARSGPGEDLKLFYHEQSETRDMK